MVRVHYNYKYRFKILNKGPKDSFKMHTTENTITAYLKNYATKLGAKRNDLKYSNCVFEGQGFLYESSRQNPLDASPHDGPSNAGPFRTRTSQALLPF